MSRAGSSKRRSTRRTTPISRGDTRYQEAISASMDAFYLLESVRDPHNEIIDFKIIDVNQHAAHQMSLPRDALIDGYICQMFPINRTNGFFERYRQVVLTGQAFIDEFMIPSGYDAPGWYHHQVVKVGDGVAIFTRDISAQKNMEVALRASEQKYRLLAENASDIVYRINLLPEMHFEYVSPSVTTITGYTPEDHYADPQLSYKLIHPDDLHLLDNLLDNLDKPLILRWICKDGSIIWTEQRNIVTRDETGEIVSIQGIARDITEHKGTEIALIDSESLLRTIVENMPVMISFFDADGRFQYTNQHWVDRLGWTAKELTATPDPLMLFYPDEQYRKDVMEYMLSAKLDWREFETHTKHNGVLTTSWVNVRLPDGRSIGIGQDVTELKKARHREFELALEKERLNLLTRFIQSAAHEFRTPLSAMSTNAYLLLRTDDPQQRKLRAENIEQQVRNIAKLVDKLLLMAQIENVGRNAFSPVEIGVALLPAIQIVDDTHRESVQLTFDIPDGLPLVMAEPHYLKEAFIQLIDNACCYTPAGGQVQVTVSADNVFLRVRVQDSGVGISAEDIPHIFETFWRKDQAHTTPGFGLGLAIARRIIELHTGSIEVQSQVGGGSVFTVMLPVTTRTLPTDDPHQILS